jgi:hypothetical protein
MGGDAAAEEEMTTHYSLVRIYVGPVHLEWFVQQAIKAGWTNVWPGTAHVYGTVAHPPFQNLTDRQVFQHQQANLIYGEPGLWWKDVEILKPV